MPIDNVTREMNAELPTPKFSNDFTSIESDGKSDGMLKIEGLKNLLFQRLDGLVDDGVGVGELSLECFVVVLRKSRRLSTTRPLSS